MRASLDPAADSGGHSFAFHECKSCGAAYNDRRRSFYEPEAVDEQVVPEWADIFPFEPWDHQADAIEELIRTTRSGGFGVIEGGCGTGKTLTALTSGLYLVYNPATQFERLFVLTSVKQQLRQFEEDLRQINKHLPDGVAEAKSITLVGKGDLCPYAVAGEGGMSESNVNRKCQDVRHGTSTVLGNTRYDGGMLAREIADGSFVSDERAGWGAHDAESPYPDVFPTYDDEPVCPFYAMYQGSGVPLFGYEEADESILRAEELVELGQEAGVCPHSAMSSLCRDADVVLGNYYHAFDSDTLNITHFLLDESTLVICDEAHMLEPKVRDIDSDSEPLFGFSQARGELASILATMNEERYASEASLSVPPIEIVDEALAKEGLSLDVLEYLYTFYGDVDRMLTRFVGDWLERNTGSRVGRGLDTPVEIPLRPPRDAVPDALSSWVEDEGVPEYIWEVAERAGDAVAEVAGEMNDQGPFRAETLGRLLRRWQKTGHERYFRELTLHRRESPAGYMDGWRQHYTASLELHCSLPKFALKNRLSSFGAGILMSATLEPLHVYTKAVGLDQFGLLEESTRQVRRKRVYADFPEDNRLSLTLAAPEFTFGNRGTPGEDLKPHQRSVRGTYADAIETVCGETPGNVLVCMPSYREAKWAASVVRNSSVQKPVLVDEASDEAVTKALKQEFFTGGGKVLVTSLRGVLTEGVDYDGEKLNGCIVCGVPIENMDSPQTMAMVHSYRREFAESDGFDYGLSVPAVRKARQALGRVIRGDEDVGVRVLVDERYADTDDGVREFLGDRVDGEYDIYDSVDAVGDEIRSFWTRHADYHNG